MYCISLWGNLILTNLKTFYYLGMEMNANVMHVKNINIIKVFQFLYYLYIFIS